MVRKGFFVQGILVQRSIEMEKETMRELGKEHSMKHSTGLR